MPCFLVDLLSSLLSKILHIFKCLVEDTVDRNTTCQNRLVSFHSCTHSIREKGSFYNNCYICAWYLGLQDIENKLSEVHQEHTVGREELAEFACPCARQEAYFRCPAYTL